MKFIHTADLHLDSPLRGLSSYADAPAERLRTATRDAFQNLVTQAIDEQVDFMVVAGDVYDGDWKDFNTGLFFVRQMGRLRHAGIPVYLLYGNHDADSEMTRGLELPDNVHVFSSRKAETFRIEHKKVSSTWPQLQGGCDYREPAPKLPRAGEWVVEHRRTSYGARRQRRARQLRPLLRG
jgi:DNA repair exonuclease SbcCD nuclease subunit